MHDPWGSRQHMQGAEQRSLRGQVLREEPEPELDPEGGDRKAERGVGRKSELLTHGAKSLGGRHTER